MKMTHLVLRLYGMIAYFFLFSATHHFGRSGKDALDHYKDNNQPGVCSYGLKVYCCFRWKDVDGVCQPVCRKSCVNGKCVGPDKCLCSTGYKGPQCDEDVNECGLSERPCSQRCMNTPGSYRCYCKSGYSLSADRHTCIQERDCFSTRCQFGCEMDRDGEAHCLCPSGLQLAPDRRTCEDIDECKENDACPPRRSCKNTFGGFACMCPHGFVTGMEKNSITCRDEDECLTGSHKCSRHAWCVNTDGSYTCRCLKDYFGNGRTCWPKRAPQSRSNFYFNYKLSKITKPVNSQL